MALDATFWVAALQLLVSLYQLRSSRSEKVQLLIGLREEILTRAPEDPKAFIQARLDAELPGEESAAVQADLSTIELLGNAPIEASAFDYWSLLQQLMTTLREFCHSHNIFRLRGLGDTMGSRFLELPRTSAAMFDTETRSHWLRARYGGTEARGTGNATLYLAETPRRPQLRYGVEDEVYLPVRGQVTAQYIEYDHGGYGGPPPLQSEILNVYVIPGADVHWLRFESSENWEDIRKHCVISSRRMLTAPAVLEIVKAAREDLISYIGDLLGEQQFSGSHLQSGLRELMAQLAASRPQNQEM